MSEKKKTAKEESNPYQVRDIWLSVALLIAAGISLSISVKCQPSPPVYFSDWKPQLTYAPIITYIAFATLCLVSFYHYKTRFTLFTLILLQFIACFFFFQGQGCNLVFVQDWKEVENEVENQQNSDCLLFCQ